jgi:hypothetical protein
MPVAISRVTNPASSVGRSSVVDRRVFTPWSKDKLAVDQDKCEQESQLIRNSSPLLTLTCPDRLVGQIWCTKKRGSTVAYPLWHNRCREKLKEHCTESIAAVKHIPMR